jgi:peptide/nickel transport system ATP-binding protein
MSRLILEALALKKRYSRGRWPAKPSRVVALDDVSLQIQEQSTLALVGKSGSGKSTLARCLALLEKVDSGEISFRGTNLLALNRSELFAVRGDLQLVFQHSAMAINPRFSAVETVTEPLLIRKSASRKHARERALGWLGKIGIPAAAASRNIHQFSGGQRRRIALARALVLEPKLMILDEILSGLDLMMQRRIADLLLQMQRDFSISYLFITHDIRMASFIADRIAIMDRGRIVETGIPSQLFRAPQRTETSELIESIPRIPDGPPAAASNLA